MLFVTACSDAPAPRPQSQIATSERPNTASSANPAAKSDQETIDGWTRIYEENELAFKAYRAALTDVLSNPTFADQHEALRSLLANADLVRKEHADSFLRAARGPMMRAAFFHYMCHGAAESALFQVAELIKGLPSDSKQRSIERIQDFMRTYQGNLSQWTPVLASYSQAGTDVHARFGADPKDLENKLTESVPLAQSVPSYIAMDDVVTAYIVGRNATLLMDVVFYGLGAAYYDEVYVKSRPAKP
jgi:hypothetical protein